MAPSTEWNILRKFEATHDPPNWQLLRWHRIKKNTAVAGRRQSSFASQETETASLAGKQCRKSQAIVCIGENIFFFFRRMLHQAGRDWVLLKSRIRLLLLLHIDNTCYTYRVSEDATHIQNSRGGREVTCTDAWVGHRNKNSMVSGVGERAQGAGGLRYSREQKAVDHGYVYQH
jgi:hypothetical protein